jgi:hypothetical protein
VLVYLDISASMNHDERGMYQAPKSKDHPAASIKKARDSFPQIVLAALKRGNAVSIVPWNYKCLPPISFTPEMYADAESGELPADDAILADVAAKTSDSVFCAHGGTNIEAALRDTMVRCRDLAARVASISVWFVTDGEETVYFDAAGHEQHVPSNTADRLYSYFTAKNERGTTAYQRKLCEDARKIRAEIDATGTFFTYHVCFTGDAEPQFLSALREATGGHFHVLAKLAGMAAEMVATATEARCSITLLPPEDVPSATAGGDGAEHVLPAAVYDGAVCCRAQMPQSVFEQVLRDHRVRLRVSPPLNIERTLSAWSEMALGPQLTEGIRAVLQLEPDLGRVLSSLSAEITTGALTSASLELRALRQRQVDAIAAISHHVRAGTILQSFLERVLESVQSQMDSLARILEQYHVQAGARYDTESAKKNDLLNPKDRQAIAAGLQSMKVRLGTGFASQSLDRQVQKLVAMHGPRARRMLARVALLAETPRPAAGITVLTLSIVEGDAHDRNRTALVRELARENPEAVALLALPAVQVNHTEQLTHADDDTPICNVTVVLSAPDRASVTLRATVPFSRAYPNGIVAQHTCKPRTAALLEASKRLTDPLSFSGFLDLIREHGTLPAALYTIGASQSAGLLFNAKEALHVVEGGIELTSFQFFRLYWRLSHDQDGMVTVPGCFHEANAAIPLAPDPLSGMLLSTTMSSLISEFVTGTPLAPLTAWGHLFIGFLLSHMRAMPHTGVDVTRMGELLATLGVFLNNPHTVPKPEEVAEFNKALVTDQGVASAESPGKFFPIKAVAYSILDDKNPIAARYSAITRESFRRALKLLMPSGGQRSPTADKHISPKLLD